MNELKGEIIDSFFSVSLDTILLFKSQFDWYALIKAHCFICLISHKEVGGKAQAAPPMLSLYFCKVNPLWHFKFCSWIHAAFFLFFLFFSVVSCCHVHELITDLVLLLFSVRRKVALVVFLFCFFIMWRSLMFLTCWDQNQTVSVCHGPVQPAGEIYCLILTRGRTQESHGGAETCRHHSAFLWSGYWRGGDVLSTLSFANDYKQL